MTRPALAGRTSSIALAGAALFVAAAAWALADPRGSGNRAALAIAAPGAVLFGARWVAGRSKIAVPAALILVAAGFALAEGDGLLSARPLAGPFGYVNVTGALFMLVSIAGLMVAVATRHPLARVAGAAVAVAAAIVPVAGQVVASAVLAIALPLVVLALTWGGRSARTAVVVCAVVFVAGLGASAALGARTWPPPARAAGLEATVQRVLTPERLALWGDAERLLARHPARGVGAGRFGDVASTSGERRANLHFWAQHDFLQQGAEQGVAGLVLLVALFGWGFVALWLVPDADAFTALAAAALAAAGIQASGDYILQFPAITLALAALVGAGLVPGTEKVRP